MAGIRLNRQAAHSGQLPRVCICCGGPAQQFVRHEFRFEPTWLILLTTAFPKLQMVLTYDTFNLNVPVCERHTSRFKWPTYVGLATAGLMVLMLIPIFALYATGNTENSLYFVPLFLLVVLTYVVTRFALLFSGPRVVQYSAGALALEGVSDVFAQHAGGRGDYAQTPQYAPQQVYTGNYGLTQAAYQNTCRPAAGPANYTLWIVLAAVFVPILLMALLAVGVLFSRGYSRFQRDREFSEMRNDFRDTMIQEQAESQQRAAEAQRKRQAARTAAAAKPPAKAAEDISASPSAAAGSGGAVESPFGSPEGGASSEFRAAPSQAAETGGSEPAAAPGSATDSTSAAEDKELQVGDVVYFELFGAWRKAKITEKLPGGTLYRISYYDDTFKRELQSARPASQLARKPPQGATIK